MIFIFHIYDAVGWETNKIKISLLPDIFIPLFLHLPHSLTSNLFTASFFSMFTSKSRFSNEQQYM